MTTTGADTTAAGTVPLRTRLVPPRLDVGIALVFVALSMAEVVVNGTVESVWMHVVVGGGAMAAIAWRRRFPVLVAFLVTSSNLVVNPEGEFTVLLSLVLVMFTAGAELDPPRSYLGLAAGLVPFLGGIANTGRLLPSDVAAAAVFLAGPWAVGSVLRQRSAHTAEAVARAARLEREQEAQAAAAVEAERTRIARELHDIVSHSISVVTIQTQAVRRRLGPEHAREAADLAAVEATAREALAEMRRLFGVLRSSGESASLAPQPGLAELPRLVAQAHSADVEVGLEVDGEPFPLPPGADLAAYRIAQEGITNALRHADAGQVRVRLRYAPGEVEVQVEDDGRGLEAHAPGGGHGLIGVRERVALYGGTVQVTGTPGGGFRLVATLPVKEAP